MADQYEEQARAAVDSLEITWGDERDYDEAVMVVARLARRSAELAAEDATRRERARVAAYIDTEAGCTANPDARARLTCVAHEIRIGVMQHVETTPVGPDPCATPPPPRPATGEARCSHLTNAPHEICTAIATTTDPTGCYPLCAEHAARYAPTPPARTDAEAIGDFQRKMATAGVSMSPPARTEHASEHATSQAVSKPARTEDGGRCAYMGCSCAGRIESHRLPPPEPEAARCERVTCGACKGAKVVNTPSYVGACNDCEGKGSRERCHVCRHEGAKVRALVEAARAALPLLIPVVGEHADHVLCEGCNEYGATADDVKHRDGCRVVKFIAALAGVEA